MQALMFDGLHGVTSRASSQPLDSFPLFSTNSVPRWDDSIDGLFRDLLWKF